MRIPTVGLIAMLWVSPIATVRLGPNEPSWGIMGGWSGVSMPDLYARGVRVVDLPMSWRDAEPDRDRWNEAYFAAKRLELERLRADGFRVVLNYGIEHAPSWMLDRPGGRFVNQSGEVYRGSDEPNLVWAGRGSRRQAREYTAKVFRALGTDFLAVRVGGGHWGELTYPTVPGPNGRPQNDYWAFDERALAQDPVPAWRPCRPSPRRQASRFLHWYLDSLTRYQNRQISWVRRGGFDGTIAVLYPSWGMREGDFDAAVSTDLCGTSPAEINGEVQRGFDHARHIAGLRDPNIAVWGTWAEKEGTISWLAGLARAAGLTMMGENSGSDDPTEMAAAVDAARRFGLSLFMWVRAEEAYCACNGYATIDDYERLIA
jgi:hypothetical protein